MSKQSNCKPDSVDIDKLINELKVSFINELPQRLDNLESIILDANNPELFHDQYETIYREIHSLKGLGGSYGIHIITSICHAMEDELSTIQGKFELYTQYGIDYWLKYIDLIRTVVEFINTNNSNFESIEHELKQLQSTKPDGSISKSHCLVVASSTIYEQMLCSSFASLPIKFSFCDNGYEALGRLLNESFDLLITDFETPLMNGLALIGSLRLSSHKNKNITSILLTSKTQHNLEKITDPDYIVYKNKDFSPTITAIITELIRAKK